MAKFTFSELRTITLAAYDKHYAFQSGTLPISDLSPEIGALFYPQNLPNDQRRLGGMIALSIKTLDDHFATRWLFDGPAFADDTRRLLVADVVASAHIKAQDLGYLHKIIRGWYPDDLAPAAPVTPDRPSRQRLAQAIPIVNDRETLDSQLGAIVTSVLAACEMLGDVGGVYPKAVAQTLNMNLHQLHSTISTLLNPEGEG